MLHYLKLHAKPVVKFIAQVTNVAALIFGSLQATGVLGMLEPKLNVLITLGVISLNMLAHALKPYIEVDTPTGVVAAPAVLVPQAPVAVPQTQAGS